MTPEDTGTVDQGSPTRVLRIRCDELSPRIADLAANLAMIEAAIVDAVANSVQLLVLPELATSGYYLRDQEEGLENALRADDPVFERWAALLAEDTVVVVGFCESFEGALSNSSCLITAAGVQAVYRKTHLWEDEKDLFIPGSAQPPVVDTPLGRIGLLVCYDLEFPEMPRSLVLRGAELLAVCTNWPLSPKPSGERAPEVMLAMAAARSSCVPILVCDRAGNERGHTWTRGTTIIGKDGWPVAERDEHGRVSAEIRLEANPTRIGPRNDVINDRRPELYGAVVQKRSELP